MSGQLISKSIADDNFSDHIRRMSGDGRVVADVSGARHAPWKSGFDERRLYRWEIIPREGYVIIHTFPSDRLLMDYPSWVKNREAVRYCCNTVLMNLRFLAEYYDEPGMDIKSFCISFLNVPQWREISEMFLRDLQKDFYKRLL
jgi:hypothetical protein